MPRLQVSALVAGDSPDAAGGRLERLVRRAARCARAGCPADSRGLLWPERCDADGVPAIEAAAGGCLGPPNRRPSTAAAATTLDGRLDRGGGALRMAGARRTRRTQTEDGARTGGSRRAGARPPACGSCARRSAGWRAAARGRDAAGGALALAGSLLRRGRTRDAQSVIAEGRDYGERAGAQGTLADLAVLSGEAWIDLERLDEADSVLGAVLAASRAVQDPERIAAASLALARASYWRGAFADGAAIVGAAPDVPALRVRRLLLECRVALGLGDLNHAMSLLTRVSAEAAGFDVVGRAAIAYVSALVHLAAGDLNAAERDLSETLALARAARDPQRAIRAWLLRAEIERGRERPAAAQSQLQRIGRMITAAPPIVRARWELAKASSHARRRRREWSSRGRPGPPASARLALYLAARPRGGASSPSVDSMADPFADELVAILRVCQTAADEGELLKTVCTRLRQHLHAAGGRVRRIVRRRPRLDDGRSDGGRVWSRRSPDAPRSAGVTIAPHRLQDRIEAAAPIEIRRRADRRAVSPGGRSGRPTTRHGPAPVLTMSATAAAPVLAAVAARRARAGAGSRRSLLGLDRRR